MTRAVRYLIAASAAITAMSACGEEPVEAERCIVRLHGKGGSGTAPTLNNDTAILSPPGNGTGWEGRQWEYDSVERLNTGVDIVTDVVDDTGCTRVVLHGFSNGASMVTAMVCDGRDLDGRLVGAVIDDPVTDAASEGCERDDRIPVTLYWTGALDDQALPGTSCAEIDWTCAGGTVRGIEAFAADLGVESEPSPFTEHRWFLDTDVPADMLG